MKLPAVKETLLTHIRSSGAHNPENISDCVMQHVLGRTRKGNCGPIGGHTYICAGNCVVIISYNANGLVDYISSHPTGPRVEDVRK